MDNDPFDDEFKDEEPEGEFLCPECGSGDVREHLFVSPAEPAGADPWSCVLEMLRCGRCWSWVPAHIGKRWDGMTVDRAKEEWRNAYRQGGISRRRREAEATRPRQSRTSDPDDGAHR